jgi:hypothetical protein
MRPRNTYTEDGTGRNFTRPMMELYRHDLCQQLEREGKADRAASYARMSLEDFAHQGGYVIVKD